MENLKVSPKFNEQNLYQTVSGLNKSHRDESGNERSKLSSKFSMHQPHINRGDEMSQNIPEKSPKFNIN